MNPSFSVFCFLMHAWPLMVKAGKRDFKLKDCNDELVLLTGQQLGGIRFEAVKGKN